MKRGVCFFVLMIFSSLTLFAQCTLTNATDCVCLDPNEIDCDLLPDITVEWDYGENDHTEYAPGYFGPEGRVTVSGHTPNIGVGPLNLRGVDEDGYRWMVCADANGVLDTFTVYDPNWNVETYCPDGSAPKHIAFQRIYHKNADGSMTYWERMANTFEYHPTHGHMHFDDWTILTLRIPDPNIPHPLDWPIVGDGSKLGFCVMDLSNCVSNDCRDDATEYGQGNVLSQSDFPNYGLGGGSYGCSPVSQGISSGYSDIYGEYLDGMWFDVPVGTCNGDYAVVLQCGKGEMLESNPDNNYTWFPITLTQQTPSPSASITASGPTVLCPGETVTLTASTSSNNPSYLWSDGSTSSSITVSQSGFYSVEVNDASFGGCASSSSNYIEVVVAPTPVDLSMASQLNAPTFEVQSNSGSYLLCNNASLTLEVVNSNATNATYLWSNGDTGPTTSISAVGDYSVVVTDNGFACNSTVSDVISVTSPVAAPSLTATQDTICVGEAVELTSSSGSATNWYNDALGVNLVGTGSSFNTSVLSSTSSFYATTTILGGDVGENSHTGSSDYSGGSTNGWISFDVSIPITINAVDVYTDTDGDRTIVVWDEGGNVVQSQSFYIQSTNGGSDPTTVPLNFSIPVGNNFIIGTDTAVNNQNFGNNNPMLKRQGDQYYGYCNYPYIIDNVVELKNSPYGNDWYYYFYNWDVNPLACESPLTPYEITVVSCASVDENVLSVKIYPNPTTEIVTIDGVANGVFSLTNVLGENVKSGVLKESTIVSLENISKGVYTIIIESENKKYTDKIVVQ